MNVFLFHGKVVYLSASKQLPLFSARNNIPLLLLGLVELWATRSVVQAPVVNP